MSSNKETNTNSITYKDIEKANKLIETSDIKGKKYAEVNQRVKAFRSIYPMGVIRTDIVSIDNGVVIMRATVIDEDNKIIATGLAQEKENSTYINKTSYIENCETSAVGRALGFAGFGIDSSICSAEEITNAINNQSKKPTPIKYDTKKSEPNYKDLLSELCKSKGVETAEVAKVCKLNAKSTNEDFKKAYERFKAKYE